MPRAHEYTATDHQRLLTVVAGGVVLAVLARLVMLVVHALLGRQLGSGEYGALAFALGLSIVLAQVSSLGWQVLIPRFIAEYSVRNAWGLLRGVLRRALQVTASGALVTAAAAMVLAASGWLELDVARSMSLVAVLVVPLALRRLFRRELVAVGWPRLAILLDSLMVPTAMLAVLLGPGIASARAAAWSYALLALLATVLTAFAVRAVIAPEANRASPEMDGAHWLRATLSGWTGRVARILTVRADILMLGPMLGMQAVGYYSAAHRLSFVLTFIPALVGGIVGPHMSRAFFADDLPEVRRLFLRSMGLAVVIGLVVAPVLILAPDQVVRLVYGEGFEGAVRVLPILVLGQFVSACSGPVTALLTMTGLERDFARSALAMLVFSVLANLVAITTVGLIGVAWVTTVSISILVLWQLHMVAGHIGLVRPRSAH